MVKTVDMSILCSEKVLRQAVIQGTPVRESDPKPIKSAIMGPITFRLS